MFSSDELNKIYDKVKLPESYFNKYTLMPSCPVRRYNYNWANYDFPRNWCILDFIEWMKKYNINIDHLGYTCNEDPELEFIAPHQKTLVSYPDYDLHNFSTHFKTAFDFFIFNQTIEHLYNPFEAVKQIYETLKPGGYVFTSVPTINIPHMTPIHFNGFTPMGLAMLFKTANFEIIEIGQWGNFEYITKLWNTHSWPGYDRLHHNNSVTNEERNVCQCWILAKKNPVS
jgi:SAM-dependent methyltransferase